MAPTLLFLVNLSYRGVSSAGSGLYGYLTLFPTWFPWCLKRTHRVGKIQMFTPVDFGDFSLRRFVSEDVTSLAEAANDPRIARNLRDRFPHPYSLDDARYFIDVVCANEHEPIWAIVDSTGIIGSIGLHINDDVHRYSAELGYWLRPDRWGRGIVTRVVRYITQLGLNDLGLRRIYAMVYESNPPSIRVLEKAGFVCEGILRSHVTKQGQLLDVFVYAQTQPKVLSVGSGSWGISDTISPLQAVLLHPPAESLVPGDTPQRWGYDSDRNSTVAQHQFRAYCDLLESEGVRVLLNEEPVDGDLDAIYQCDSAVMTPHGAVINTMGKELRRLEPQVTRRSLEKLGVPIVGEIMAPGTLEGGDVIWLDSRNVAVGMGYRTNRQGITQFQTLLAPHGIRVRPVELPHGPGPHHCLHLRSLLNVLRQNLVIAYKPWLSATFLQELEQAGMVVLDAVAEELDTQGNNLLVVRPGRVVIVAGNPKTETLLMAHGVTPLSFDADELCIKGSGGPTCLALDLARNAF